MKKRIHALAVALLLIFGGGSSTAAATPEIGDTVEVIVELNTDDADAIQTFAKELSASFPNADYGYLYDTLLYGFQMTLPENLIGMLEARSIVRDVYRCGSYAPMSAVETTDTGMDAAELVGYAAAREAGLTGSGITIAVIDTSFDITHAAFDGEVEGGILTKNLLTKRLKSRDLTVSSYIASAEAVYINSKIPFAFDYNDKDTDVYSAANHGTHVAGIIGALETASGYMEGIAPDCQLLLMKVFDDENTGTTDATVLAAIEDAVILGADIINLSLGSYSGSSGTKTVRRFNKAIKKAQSAGCIIVAAAGNEAVSTVKSTIQEETGTTLPPAAYTDYGTISYPASLDYTFSVGSAENTYRYSPYFRSEDPAVGTINYDDTNQMSGVSTLSFAEYFDGQSLKYVAVPGIGADSDYAGLNLSGKLALVMRGTTTFVEKATIAASHGAVGMIVYNNVEDSSFSMDLTDAPIPAIAIIMSDGLTLSLANQKRLTFNRADISTLNENAGRLSAFSSVGTTPSLTLQPEICAVGGDVYSTVTGGGYEGMSGTSMAAPQLSGACALLLERDRANDTAIDRSGVNDAIKTLLMNSATLLLQENGVEYSPRFQGAGRINLDAALSSELEMVYAVNGKPKVELYDLLGDKLSMDVTVTNLGDDPLSLTLSTTLTNDGYTLMTYESAERYFSTLEAEADRYSRITVGDTGNLNRYAQDYAPLEMTLEAGESKTLTIELARDAAYSKTLSEIYTNGYFAEGFILCETENHTYSMPYMGYVGDWSDALILDGSVYGGETVLFDGTQLVTVIKEQIIPAGISLYSAEPSFDPAQVAFSPNGDGMADAIYIRTELLRNVAVNVFTVTDTNGQVVYIDYDPNDYLIKTEGIGTNNVLYFGWTGGDGNNLRYVLPDGTYTLKLELTLDYLSDLEQNYYFPVILDTKQPELQTVSYDVDTGILTVSVLENAGLQYIGVYDGLTDKAFMRHETEFVSDGEGFYTAQFDLSEFDGDTFYVEAVDNAYNSSVGVYRRTEVASHVLVQ